MNPSWFSLTGESTDGFMFHFPFRVCAAALNNSKKKRFSGSRCRFGFHVLTRQRGRGLPLLWMKASLGGTGRGWIPSVTSCSRGEVRLMIL